MRQFLAGGVSALVLGGVALFVAVQAGVVIGQPAERCLLGFPNSGNVVVVELRGRGAYDVCDDQTNPIRMLNAFEGASVLAAPWSGLESGCKFDRYGLAWTIWLPSNWPAVDAIGNKQDCATLAERYR